MKLLRPAAWRQVRSRRFDAFTIIELLVAMSVLGLILVVVASVIQSTSKAWRSTTEKIDSFRGSRAAFELMTNQLRQATLNTYYDYYDSEGKPCLKQAPPTSPVAYGRLSELHFISGPNLVPGQITDGVFFQMPLGFSAVGSYASLNSLLNVTGFYITFGSNQDALNRPPPVSLLGGNTTYRYRLMQFVQPTEKLKVYDTSAAYYPTGWFTDPLSTATAKDNVRILANNIIALIILPRISTDKNNDLTSDYRYDSRNTVGFRTADTSIAYEWKPGAQKQPLPMNQMPPLLQIVMVALDENSAARLQGDSTSAPPAITAALAGKFTDPLLLDQDLEALEAALNSIAPKIGYRILNTTISIRGAKFSDQ